MIKSGNNSGSSWFPGTRSGDSCSIDNWEQSVEPNDGSGILDEKSWPKNLPANKCLSTIMMYNSGAPYPTGAYVILWEGQGKIALNGNVVSSTGTTESRTTYNVTSATSADLKLSIVESNPSNNIRNIRVLTPGGVCGTSPTNLDYFKGCGATNMPGCSGGETCS